LFSSTSPPPSRALTLSLHDALPILCFATVAYSGESDVDSIIHVPEFVLGRRGGRVWLTSISTNATPPTPPVLQAEPLRRVASARATDGNLDSAKWAQLVAEVAA